MVGETKNKKTVSETNLLAGNTTSVESPGTLVQGLLRCEKNSNSEQTKERTEEKQRGAGEHANGQQTTGIRKNWQHRCGHQCPRPEGSATVAHTTHTPGLCRWAHTTAAARAEERCHGPATGPVNTG